MLAGRVTITIEVEDWPAAGSVQKQQPVRNTIGAVIKMLADRIVVGGNECRSEAYPGIVASFRLTTV